MNLNIQNKMLTILGGIPDLNSIRHFIAMGNQGVSYAANVWHTPMIALDDDLDFAVFQFANDVAREDCEEVELDGQVHVLVESNNAQL